MQKLRQSKKIVLAVGGTGGHLFPAQALARDLLNAGSIDLLFAGHGLSTNRYFKRELFPFEEIESGTPRKGMGALVPLARGLLKSRKLLKEFSPDLVVGFGSFHSFPLLLAAQLKGIPYVLFTPDVIPGQVNRLFSKRALFTGVQFQETADFLKGKAVLVQMPCWCMEGKSTREMARLHYGLDPECLTLLAFGGSQGAEAINHAVSRLELKQPFQVIHFTGVKEGELRALYAERKIRAHVAAFEEKMERAYLAADLAICRAGAATLGELIAFELPALLIPWPGAADQHQEKNARVFIEQTGGGKWIDQKNLSPHLLSQVIDDMNIVQMKQNLAAYKMKKQETRFANLILNQI